MEATSLTDGRRDDMERCTEGVRRDGGLPGYALTLIDILLRRESEARTEAAEIRSRLTGIEEEVRTLRRLQEQRAPQTASSSSASTLHDHSTARQTAKEPISIANNRPTLNGVASAGNTASGANNGLSTDPPRRKRGRPPKVHPAPSSKLSPPGNSSVTKPESGRDSVTPSVVSSLLAATFPLDEGTSDGPIVSPKEEMMAECPVEEAFPTINDALLWIGQQTGAQARLSFSGDDEASTSNVDVSMGEGSSGEQWKHEYSSVRRTKPFKCPRPDCVSSFFDQYALDVHIACHDINTDGPKTFPCLICGRVFPKWKYMQKHAKIHSEIRGHECEYCGKSFKRSDHKKMHVDLIHLKIVDRQGRKIVPLLNKEDKKRSPDVVNVDVLTAPFRSDDYDLSVGYHDN